MKASNVSAGSVGLTVVLFGQIRLLHTVTAVVIRKLLLQHVIISSFAGILTQNTAS